MKTQWTGGVNKDDKKEIELSFNGSGVLRKRLGVLIEAKIKAAEKDSYSKEGYDCPNWAYKQADLAGYKRSLKEIISLIS